MAAITAKLKPAGKKGFFDTTEVIKAIGRAKVKIFNEYGRLVRKRALASMPYSDKPSPSGTPPHAHRSRKRKRVSKSTGKTRVRAVSFLREFLYYKYDTVTGTVVVGPEKLNNVAGKDVPHVLEYGGSAKTEGKEFFVTRAAGRDVKGRFVSRGKEKIVIPAGTYRIAPRPFMHPAAAEEAKALPSMWRDSVR
jgi:hypothetical protein